MLYRSAAESTEEPQAEQPVQQQQQQPQQQPTVIQAGDDLLIGDLLSLDIPSGPPISLGGGGGGGLEDLDLLGADLGGLNVSYTV